MDTIYNPAVWQRRGSSIIFDHLTLAELINEAEMTPLRKALSWLDYMPAEPPASIMLIAGLETMLNVLDADAAYDFLLRRVRPLIIRAQNVWPECALVFGFTAAPQSFRIGAIEDDVLYIKRDQTTVKLSDGLWDGSATMNMKCLAREEGAGKETVIGYYVARIS